MTQAFKQFFSLHFHWLFFKFVVRFLILSTILLQMEAPTGNFRTAFGSYEKLEILAVVWYWLSTGDGDNRGQILLDQRCNQCGTYCFAWNEIKNCLKQSHTFHKMKLINYKSIRSFTKKKRHSQSSRLISVRISQEASG